MLLLPCVVVAVLWHLHCVFGEQSSLVIVPQYQNINYEGTGHE